MSFQNTLCPSPPLCFCISCSLCLALSALPYPSNKLLFNLQNPTHDTVWWSLPWLPRESPTVNQCSHSSWYKTYPIYSNCLFSCLPLPPDLRIPNGQGWWFISVSEPWPSAWHVVDTQPMPAEQTWILFPVTSRVFCKATDQDHRTKQNHSWREPWSTARYQELNAENC